MCGRELKNKPLVEAILEIKWSLQKIVLGQEIDPHYKLLLGRLFDRVSGDYPEHEQLPTANMPDEIVGHVVQHRFRTAKNTWPLLQIGPGIFTLNSTGDYTWDDFRPRAERALGYLFSAHPKPKELFITNLTLRYIDAIPFDFKNENIFSFLSNYLKIKIEFPGEIYKVSRTADKPNNFSLQSSFACSKPDGVINIRLSSGIHNGKQSLVWETTVESKRVDQDTMQENFAVWLDDAHSLTSAWFSKMIEGELEKQFL